MNRVSEKVNRIIGGNFVADYWDTKDIRTLVSAHTELKSMLERIKSLKDSCLLSNELFDYIVSGKELSDERR